MRTRDLDKERSEASHSLLDFMKLYNENLPIAFPRVSAALLGEFRTAHSTLFKSDNVWSLDLHRKKVMDWLRSRPV